MLRLNSSLDVDVSAEIISKLELEKIRCVLEPTHISSNTPPSDWLASVSQKPPVANRIVEKAGLK